MKVLNAAGIVAWAWDAIVSVGVNHKYLALPLAVFMVLASLSAFYLELSPFGVWNAIGLNSALASLTVWVSNPDATTDIMLFASSIASAWLIGLLALSKLQKNYSSTNSPFVYRALAEMQPQLPLLLFLSFLGLSDFRLSRLFSAQIDGCLMPAALSHGLPCP